MHHKRMLAVAVSFGLGFAAQWVGAAPVTSWQLGDFDGDGLQSDFLFNQVPTGNGPLKFGSFGELCGGGPCVPIAFDSGPIGINVFTTGFNFGGTGIFSPFVSGSISAEISAGSLSFSALDFSAIHPSPGGTQFDLLPFPGVSDVTVETLTNLGSGNWGVVVRWFGTPIGGSSSTLDPVIRLEGIMSTAVPVPAAAWLFGSGLLGLIAITRRK